MKNIKLLAASVIYLNFLSLNAFAKGGDVVGNGAGLTENNMIYALKLLPQLIDSCIERDSCHQNSTDLAAYKKIKIVLGANLNKKVDDVLKFVSAQGQPGFFATGANEPDRVAKTCLTPDCAIYFNIDILNRNNPSYPTLASLLTHEIGHQAGFTDHGYLDYLGAKIRVLAEARYTAYIYPYDFNKIEIRQINSDFPLKFAEVHYVWNNQTTRLTEEIYKEVSKVRGFVGFEMFNGHYLFENSAASLIQFEIWAKVYNEEGDSVRMNLMKFKLEINSLGEILKFGKKAGSDI